MTDTLVSQRRLNLFSAHQASVRVDEGRGVSSLPILDAVADFHQLISKVLVPEALLQLCIRSMGLAEDQSWLHDGADQPIQFTVQDHSETQDALPTRKPFDIPSGLDDGSTLQFKLYNQAYKTLVELTAQGDDWTRVLEELREARRMMRIIRKMPVESGEAARKEADQLRDDGRRRRKVTSFSGYEKH
jgi:hypothetical protein